MDQNKERIEIYLNIFKKFCGFKKLPKSKLNQFALYLVSLVLNLRHAYFIDSLSISADQLIDILELSFEELKLSGINVPTLLVIDLNKDIIIISYSVWENIMNSLNSKEYPFVIDISKEHATLLECHEVNTIMQEILGHIGAIDSSKNTLKINIKILDHMVLKFCPIIVGLCLSYPVIYSYIDLNIGISNALSMQLVTLLIKDKFIICLLYTSDAADE